MSITRSEAPRAWAQETCARTPDAPGFAPAGRWELLSAVRELRAELGLSRGDLETLQALLSFLPCRDRRTGEDMPATPDMVLVVYASNASVLTRTNGMSERCLRTHLARLARAGLVVRRDSSNGKRFPIRRRGKVVDAFGIDLRPAFARSAEIFRRAAEKAELAELARGIRSRLLARRRALLEIAERLGEAALTWLEKLGTVLRRKLSVRELERVEADLDDLDARLAGRGDHDRGHAEAPAAEPPCPTAPRPRASGAEARIPSAAVCGGRVRPLAAPLLPQDAAGESAARASASTTNPPAADGRKARHIESNSMRDKKPRPSAVDFELQARSVWEDCPALSEFYPLVPTDPRRMGEVLFSIGGFIALKEPLVMEALASLGWQRLARALDYLVQNAGRIEAPAGYLRAMMASAGRGDGLAGAA